MNKKNVATILAIFAMLIVAGMLGLRLWANEKKLDLPMLSTVQIGAEGRVFVLLGETLYIESSDGQSEEILPLSDFGVHGFTGDFAILSDNSILLPQGQLPPVTLKENLWMTARFAADDNTPSEPLQRCSLETRACQPLDAAGAWRAGRSFKLAVDEAAGHIYVADTARHRLVMLDMDGRILATHEEGFWFPNQMVLSEGKSLTLADTNHHRLVEIELTADGFGRELHEEFVRDWGGPLANKYPAGLVVDKHSTRWVVVATEGMNEGIVFRVPRAGRAQQLDMPAGADPLFLASLNNRVLIPDTATYRVHQFDLEGVRLADFGSPSLKSALAVIRQQYARYSDLFEGSLIVLLAVALPMLIIGLVLHQKAQEAVADDEAVTLVQEATASFQSPAAQLSRLKSEYLFWRRFTVLPSGEARRFGWLLFALFAVTTGSVAIVVLSHAQGGGKRALFDFSDPQFLLIAILTPLAITWVLLVLAYERLQIDRSGIRYTSFFSGPFVFLNALFPSWFLSWSEIADIRLKNKARGSLQHFWYFEIQPVTGKRRKLHALSWRLAGEDEAGIPISSIFRQKPALIRDVVRRTFLYRLLGERGASSS